MIYNPDYDKIRQSYKLPVFFKSSYDLSKGYLDNGRHQVPLKIEDEDEFDKNKYGMGNNIGPSRK